MVRHTRPAGRAAPDGRSSRLTDGRNCGYRLTITVSRYSLGTTIVPSVAWLKRAMSVEQVGLECDRVRPRRPPRTPSASDRSSAASTGCSARASGRGTRNVPLDQADLGDLVAEELAQPSLGAPQDRRAQSGRRRNMLADRLEQVADEPFRRMSNEADPAAGPAGTHQLARRLLLVRCEHRPEDRAHDIEAAVIDRQGLGIALDEGRPRGSSASIR